MPVSKPNTRGRRALLEAKEKEDGSGLPAASQDLEDAAAGDKSPTRVKHFTDDQETSDVIIQDLHAGQEVVMSPTMVKHFTDDQESSDVLIQDMDSTLADDMVGTSADSSRIGDDSIFGPLVIVRSSSKGYEADGEDRAEDLEDNVAADEDLEDDTAADEDAEGVDDDHVDVVLDDTGKEVVLKKCNVVLNIRDVYNEMQEMEKNVEDEKQDLLHGKELLDLQREINRLKLGVLEKEKKGLLERQQTRPTPRRCTNVAMRNLVDDYTAMLLMEPEVDDEPEIDHVMSGHNELEQTEESLDKAEKMDVPLPCIQDECAPDEESVEEASSANSITDVDAFADTSDDNQAATISSSMSVTSLGTSLISLYFCGMLIVLMSMYLGILITPTDNSTMMLMEEGADGMMVTDYRSLVGEDRFNNVPENVLDVFDGHGGNDYDIDDGFEDAYDDDLELVMQPDVQVELVHVLEEFDGDHDIIDDCEDDANDSLDYDDNVDMVDEGVNEDLTLEELVADDILVDEVAEDIMDGDHDASEDFEDEISMDVENQIEKPADISNGF